MFEKGGLVWWGFLFPQLFSLCKVQHVAEFKAVEAVALLAFYGRRTLTIAILAASLA
jgi:hypothetical protein